MTSLGFTKGRESVRQSCIIATKKQQRLSWIQRCGKNFAYDDCMVAGNVCRMQAAGDLTKCILHQRNVLRRPNKIYAYCRLIFLRLIGAREKLGKVILLFP